MVLSSIIAHEIAYLQFRDAEPDSSFLGRAPVGYNEGERRGAAAFEGIPMALPEEEGRIDWIHSIAERKIQEAIDEGLFDNLPGKGKPLVLDDDPLTPAHLRLTHHVLKNANVVPEWIAMEQEIEAAKNAALGFLEKWEMTRSRGAAADPNTARAEYLRLMKAANDLILKYNLVNPFVFRAPAPFRIKLRLEDWDKRYGEPGGGE